MCWVEKCKLWRIWTSHWDTAIELWIILFRAYAAHSLISAPASHLGFPTFIFIHGAPSVRRMTRCMCPLCSFACCQTGNGPWQADSWLPCCPPWSAVICCTVSHSHRGSQCGHWRAILDWNSSIPLSNQTNTTLKVNKNPERNTENIRAADPLSVCRPGWKYTWLECAFMYLDLHLTLICPLRYWDDYGLENELSIFCCQIPVVMIMLR